MKNIQKVTANITSALQSRKYRILLAVLTLALFVLAAGAPSATIGIGK